MIKDRTQTQETGDNSTNNQAETINNYGLSYRDVKEVALDVFKSNFLQLSEHAANTARNRAEELTENFLKGIQEKNPDLLNSVQEPSMQTALYAAQKSYAISGDTNVADMLVDVLIARSEQDERNLRQIVLDESLEVIPKLTESQLDILTLVFFGKYSTNNTVVNFETFKSYLELNFKTFTQNLTKQDSDYQHLEYCNCGSVTFGNNLENKFLTEYKGLFSKGLTLEEINEKGEKIAFIPGFFINCLRDGNKLQVNAINDKVLDNSIEQANLDIDTSNSIRALFNQNIMSEQEAKEWMSNKYDFMEKLFDYWNNSSMISLTLTTVGIAIAQANFKRKTGTSLDLSIWIK